MKNILIILLVLLSFNLVAANENSMRGLELPTTLEAGSDSEDKSIGCWLFHVCG